MPTTLVPRTKRRLPIGAEILPDGGVSFRLWAPKPDRVALVIRPDSGEPIHLPMEKEDGGYYSLTTEQAQPGTRYGFSLNGSGRILPDPASRFQPDGPAALSQVIDPQQFRWSDDNWRGLKREGQVIYELHVGTFTPEGTWRAAAGELAELARIGITMIEVMPVAEFHGRFGWGYDGVLMFAPTRLYGQPDDFRYFVDQAHRNDLGVILDVVYNHFGNVDNYLGEFSDDYKTDKYRNEWAAAINFDGKNCRAVREYFETNARYWIEEFHLDGFRYDATQSVFDSSPQYILAATNQVARRAAGSRGIYLSAENEPQDALLVKPAADGGYDMDAVWNDDFHHSATVALTGNNPAYYSDFFGTAFELAAAVKLGFVYQGQHSVWQEVPRGTSSRELPASALVSFLQNHDQISNSATGQRIHQLTSPALYRAMTAFWLLAPQTPLFFQGQEFAASAPFVFFADYQGEMADAVTRGRGEFLSQFPSLATPESRRHLPKPTDEKTFLTCKINFVERQTNRELYQLHIDLLRLRREDSVFSVQRADLLETVAMNDRCLSVRYFGGNGNDRLVVSNFGPILRLAALSNPLFAPPHAHNWRPLWDSNDRRYGGSGAIPLEADDGWQISGETTLVLAAVPLTTQS
jgi:maltooligosyltrehalose trehalohydrolase